MVGSGIAPNFLYHKTYAFYMDHKALMISVGTLFFWWLTSALLNYLLTKKTAEEWEEWALKQPKLAFIVELLRAGGLHPSSVLKTFQHYANRKAGTIPESAVLDQILRDPQKRALLLEAIAKPPSEKESK